MNKILIAVCKSEIHFEKFSKSEKPLFLEQNLMSCSDFLKNKVIAIAVGFKPFLTKRLLNQSIQYLLSIIYYTAYIIQYRLTVLENKRTY